MLNRKVMLQGIRLLTLYAAADDHNNEEWSDKVKQE